MCPQKPNIILSADVSTCANLKTHVKRRHPDRELEFDQCRKKKAKLRDNGSSKPVLKNKQVQPTLSFGKKLYCPTTQLQFDEKITAFVIDGMLPLSIVENIKFKDIFTEVCPGLNVLSRRSLGRRITEKLANVRRAIKDDLTIQEHICTTADVWSTKYRSFMGVTAHWIHGETLERHSATLACERFKGSHTYDRIADVLNGIRSRYSISENKIVATITDNGSNFVKAFKEYGIGLKIARETINEEDEGLDSDDEQEIFSTSPIIESQVDDILLPNHYRCASHTLSLVCTTDLKNALEGSVGKIHHSAMGKCSSLWNHAGKPKSAETIHSIMNCHLRLPYVTRWNSLYDSVQLLLQKKDKLSDVMSALKLPLFRDAEIDYLEEYVAVLKPIATALDRLQSDVNCFYGCFIPTLFAVEKKLKRLALSSLRYCQPLLDAVTDGFNERFDKFLHLDGAVNPAVLASVSNPMFKLKWLTIKEDMNTDEYRKMVQNMLILAIKAENSECRTNNIADEDSSSSSDDFYGYGHISANASSKDMAEMDVLKFFSDEDCSLSALSRYPRIKKVFLRYNTPLPSSAPVERLFSFAGHIHAPKRGNLSDCMFEILVMLKGNSAYV